MSPAVDSGKVWWGNTVVREGKSNYLYRYRIDNGFIDYATLPFEIVGTSRGNLIWTTVSANQVFYLPGGCTPQQPCSIRPSGPLTFTPSRRRR